VLNADEARIDVHERDERLENKQARRVKYA
jgi:hypothetical protein